MSKSHILVGPPFNNPQYVSGVLGHLKNADWTGKTFNDLILEYRSKLFTVPTYPIMMKKGTVIIGGRRNNSSKEELFDHVNKIGLKDRNLVSQIEKFQLD